MQEPTASGTRQVLPAALVVLASIGLSVGATLWLRSDISAAERPLLDLEPLRAVLLRLDDLEQRLSELEQQTSELHAEPATSRNPIDDEPRVERQPHAVDDAVATSRLTAIEKRLAQLETRLRFEGSNASALDGRMASALELMTRSDPRASRAEREAHRLAVIRACRQTILDGTSSETDKAKAHSKLRRIENAYTPAMTQELVRIALRHERPDVRAGIWRDFDGSSAAGLPQIVPALLQALSLDTSAHARREAAETLGNFPDDPAVVRALEYSAANDQDASVRNRARRTLGEIARDRRRR